jgi:hypothetical protein
MYVRPWRRTTIDPSWCFNDLSEFRTFIACPPRSGERPSGARYSGPPGVEVPATTAPADWRRMVSRVMRSSASNSKWKVRRTGLPGKSPARSTLASEPPSPRSSVWMV